MSEAIAAPRAVRRIPSIDHYRGYAIFGMILVNWLGHFDCMPWQFKHHHYEFSYADTIAPIFMFVVGMGLRLSIKKRIAKDGFRTAHLHALRRYCILAFLGLAFGKFDLRVDVWDALLDIALAGILSLPFISFSATVRIGAAVGLLALYQFCYTVLGYGEWTMSRSIDGGPLGPLSWAFILLFGTLVMDVMEDGDRRKILFTCVGWGAALIVLAYVFRAPWAGVKELWEFTHRGMNTPTPLLGSGIAFLCFLPFYFFADVWGLSFPPLTILGENPLVIYLIQYELQEDWLHPNEQWPTSYALLSYAAFFGFCYAVAYILHRKKIIVKL